MERRERSAFRGAPAPVGQPWNVAPAIPLPTAADAVPVTAPGAVAPAVVAAPLTRRELRERERAAAEVVEAAELPAVEPEAIELPAVEPEAIELPAVELPEPEAVPVIAAPASRARTLPRLPARPSSRQASTRPPSRGTARHRVGRQFLSVGAMLFSAALMVGLTVPASVFFLEPAEASAGHVAESTRTTQKLEVAATAAAPAIARDSWTSTTWAQALQAEYGSKDYSYTVGSGTVRWPFPTAVSISDGFGYRVSPCAGCSSNHQGTDFTPGAGAPIYAIADGVVTTHEDGNGGFGNYVVLTHRLNGKTITSTYAHMQRGSSPIEAGTTVKVGDFLGLVGDTGASVGAHLHLEIAISGVKVDPFAWLKANAN